MVNSNNEIIIPALRPGALFLRGAIALVFAAVSALLPGPTLLALVLWVGAYFIVDGVTALFLKTPQERTGERSYGWSIFTGVLGVVAGLLTFLYPIITAFALSILLGAWALILGGLQVMGAYEMHRAKFIGTGMRIFLGVMGLLSMALGVAIFMSPAIGLVAMITLVSVNAFVIGVASIALGLEVRRGLKAGKTLPGADTSAQKKSA